MRKSYRFIFIIIFILILAFIIYFNPNEFILNTDRSFIGNQSIDNFSHCLMDMNEALNALSIPWFLAHGTALMYWRSKNFISDDMDIGVFYKDLVARNLSEKEFLADMKNKFRFKLSHSYGQLDHGQEWTFKCPRSRINIDIFVFYPYNETNTSFTYWAASYNGLCDDMIYKKCRWGFPNFNLTTFEMYEEKFHIVSLEFIIERYGKDYMIPKKYDYFQSLHIIPNLILEYKNQTKNVLSQKKANKHSLKFRRKEIIRKFFIKLFY